MNASKLVEEPQPAPPDSFGSLIQRYQPPQGSYGEAADSVGHIRSAWQPLFNELGTLPAGEVHRRIVQAQRQLDVDGVAFNPHDSSGGVSRPWSLDPIPLVVEQTEWDQVARGLDQRARLADLILLDLLGPQTLLHERILPPDALYAHPKYSPAYHSLVPRPRKHLQLYAADLARSPDGQWWVTADRTRNPFGLGYVLENRLATSRMLPSAFGACNVQRLAPFFITLRQTLRDLANRFRDNPRIAIWSKGPTSRGYFEDAFLARYLGYTLVEGGDLAVRDNRVMLKTLGGLLPVEVLWRRVEDHHCDAAELVTEENFGVSGLLEVIRSGHVSVCNSIGSALSESPMLLAFMPKVCKHLLGEDLALPSVATWWCGEPKALKHVMQNMDDLIIRRAYRGEDEAPQHPGLMSNAERQKLVERVNANPSQYVGQEQVTRSTAPVWEQGQLQSWALALRAFMVAQGESYSILPGALARVSPDPQVLSHNMTSGEKSQDVWIVADQPVQAVSLLTVAGSKSELKRGGDDLPSRVADNLFWLGRNLERAEQLSRLVRITLQQLTGEDASTAGAIGLADACRSVKQVTTERSSNDDAGHMARQITLGSLDAKIPQSLRSVVVSAYQTAAKVRDRISLDSFRVVTELRDLLNRQLPDTENTPTDLTAMLDEAITLLHAISGLVSESMTRTQGWRSLDLGRRIERVYQTSRMIRSLLPINPEDTDMAQALKNCLQICDSYMTYRSRYLADIQPAAVLDLIITDETNPRSILFQLKRICDHVDRLPRPGTQATMSSEQRIALSLYNAVRLTDPLELSYQDNRGEYSSMHKLFARLIEQLPRLSDAISGKFLIHAGVQRHYALSSNPIPGPRR